MRYDQDGSRSSDTGSFSKERQTVERTAPPADCLQSPFFTTAESAVQDVGGSRASQFWEGGKKRYLPASIGRLFHWRMNLLPVWESLCKQHRSLRFLEEQLRSELHRIPDGELPLSVRSQLDYFADSLQNEEQDLQRIHAAVEELDQLLQALTTELSPAEDHPAESGPPHNLPRSEDVTGLSQPNKHFSEEHRTITEIDTDDSAAKQACHFGVCDTDESDIFEHLFGEDTLAEDALKETPGAEELLAETPCPGGSLDEDVPEKDTPMEGLREENTTGYDISGYVSLPQKEVCSEETGNDFFGTEAGGTNTTTTGKETSELEGEGIPPLHEATSVESAEPQQVRGIEKVSDEHAATGDSAVEVIARSKTEESDRSEVEKCATDEKTSGDVIGVPAGDPSDSDLTDASVDLSRAQGATKDDLSVLHKEAKEEETVDETCGESALKEAVSEIQSVLTSWFASSDVSAETSSAAPSEESRHPADAFSEETEYPDPLADLFDPQAVPPTPAEEGQQEHQIPEETISSEFRSPSVSPSACDNKAEEQKEGLAHTEPLTGIGSAAVAPAERQATESGEPPAEEAGGGSSSGSIELISAKWLKDRFEFDSSAEKEASESHPTSSGQKTVPDEGTAGLAQTAYSNSTAGISEEGNSCLSRDAEVDLDDATNPDTIAAYMQRLLQRQQPLSSHYTPDPVIERPGEKAEQRGMSSAGETKSSPVSVSSPSSAETKEPPAETVLPPTSLPLETAPRIDKESIRAGIATMRELANQQAQQALATHRWNRSRRRIFLKAQLAVVSGVASLLLLTSEWWAPQSLVNLAWPVVTLAGILAIDCFRAVGHFRRILRPGTGRSVGFLQRIGEWNLSVRSRLTAAVSLLAGGAFLVGSERWLSLSLTGYGWSLWGLAGALFLDLLHDAWEKVKCWVDQGILLSPRSAAEAAEGKAEPDNLDEEMTDPELGLPRAHFTDEQLEADVMSVFLSSELPAFSPDQEEGGSLPGPSESPSESEKLPKGNG